MIARGIGGVGANNVGCCLGEGDRFLRVDFFLDVLGKSGVGAAFGGVGARGGEVPCSTEGRYSSSYLCGSFFFLDFFLSFRDSENNRKEMDCYRRNSFCLPCKDSGPGPCSPQVSYAKNS